MTGPADAPEQLATLAKIVDLLESHGIVYWLFGGWAVDFHAGRVTRPHADLDIAVWVEDRDRITDLLLRHGWQHRPDAGEDGYTCYVRGPVRLEIAFLAVGPAGHVFTPLRDGRGEWPAGTFGEDVLELHGISARLIRREALIADKSVVRGDPVVAAKDRADMVSLGCRL